MFLSLDLQQLFLFKFSIDISNFIFLFDFVFMKGFILCDYLFVFPGSPYFVLDLFLLTRGLLNCAYYYPLSSGYLYHLISFLLLNYHFSSPLLSLVSSSLSFGCPYPPLFSYFLPRLRTYLCFLHIFCWLLHFFRTWGTWLFFIIIKIWFSVLEMFVFEISYVLVQGRHGVDLRHSLIVTFLKLYSGFEPFIFSNLSLPNGHVDFPFLPVLGLPLFSKISWFLVILDLLISKLSS